MDSFTLPFTLYLTLEEDPCSSGGMCLVLSLKLHKARICSRRLVFFVSHISYFVLPLSLYFFMDEGMEVSDAAVDTVSSTRGTRDDGDQDASLSFETITTGAATDDPRSSSSTNRRQFDCDDKEEDNDKESGTTTHASHLIA
jgi:hypothetical protein